MLYILLFTLCVVLVIVYLKTKNSNYWKKKNIIQVEDLLFKFMFDGRSLSEICKEIYDKHDVPYIGTTQGCVPSLIVKSVEDVQAVFAGDFRSFHHRGLKTNPKEVLADNLLFTNDFQKWKLMRQKLSPVFTSAKLKNMFYILDKCARDFVSLVESDENMRKTPFNVLYTYTTASIGASVFGIDTQTKNTMNSPFLEMAWKSVEPSFKSNSLIMMADIFPKLFDFLNLKFFSDHEDFFVGAVKSVLSDRRLTNDKNRHDFIETCLELQEKGVMKDASTGYEINPTDEVMAGQAFFFFVAGADTSANVMHFTLIELSSNQKVLNKLHKEIDSIFVPGKNELTYQDIENLPYLDMVVSEAMRKYPPVGVIQRKCTKDTMLPSGVKIEKDSTVVVPVFAIQRDEKYFPNPQEFDPERFGPDNSNGITNYTNLPFGEGNRICIGSRFARLQVKVGLAWLLRRFTLAEQSPYPVKFEKSTFAIRDPTARYDFIPRKV
ncbi:unnamed protein product [Arctia plantaginis]|uniref:unspecific monooxygenase n=1 Tax=Arctia plantaginis TaxID=874455 RepID=A0A8S1B3F1_ARCPL|nr:unnamed protein product [Arctia plantaginis]